MIRTDKQKETIAKWNKKYPIGTPINVTDDVGEWTRRYTESAPWTLCGDIVISVSGINGGYLLERCEPVDEVYFGEWNKMMKPALHIELDDLIEYRNDLNEIIKKLKDLNKNWDLRLSELQEEGYGFEEIYTILKILYGDE